MTVPTHTCAACGEPLAPSLARLGSLRCHDCRDNGAPLAQPPATRPAARELAHREADGLAVTLVWYAETNAVAVRVADARSGDRFEIRVAARRALDAFEHPFAYRRADGEPACRDCALAFAAAS